MFGHGVRSCLEECICEGGHEIFYKLVQHRKASTSISAEEFVCNSEKKRMMVKVVCSALASTGKWPENLTAVLDSFNQG